MNASRLDAAHASKGMVRVDCTDPAITALGSKRHMLIVPDNVTRDVLWLHLGGSGGQPSNTENIGVAAASQGYRYISLAYPNEPSIGARCTCPDGPRPANCEELVRHEVLTGDDVTPWYEMQSDEAIVPRLVALLKYMHVQQPNAGWDRFVEGDEPRWSRIAVSGFSQGGGMAGLIARDHEVDRVLYFSKGAGAVLGALVDPAYVQPCSAHDECDSGVCCGLADFECVTPPDDAICIFAVPDPWTLKGKDVDGDGVGDGDQGTRATASNRQFGLVHRDESAWGYSPAVFESWGMGTNFVDADSNGPPYGTRQLFSTALPPRGNCSEHQSMGADPCQPIDAESGRPAMSDVWIHAMRAELR